MLLTSWAEAWDAATRSCHSQDSPGSPFPASQGLPQVPKVNRARLRTPV